MVSALTFQYSLRTSKAGRAPDLRAVGDVSFRSGHQLRADEVCSLYRVVVATMRCIAPCRATIASRSDRECLPAARRPGSEWQKSVAVSYGWAEQHGLSTHPCYQECYSGVPQFTLVIFTPSKKLSLLTADVVSTRSLDVPATSWKNRLSARHRHASLSLSHCFHLVM